MRVSMLADRVLNKQSLQNGHIQKVLYASQDRLGYAMVTNKPWNICCVTWYEIICQPHYSVMWVRQLSQ